MSGDGLSDLVRIRNGEVCYWPNLGYGRFGAKVTMDGAPVFDYPGPFRPAPDPAGRHRRIRHRRPDLPRRGRGDDLVQPVRQRLDHGHPAVPVPRRRQHRRRDRLRPARQRHRLPGVDLPAAGADGAAAALHRPHRRRQAVPADQRDQQPRRPEALSYAPSTKFYLQDRAAGTPWVTRLPFPVHVVERVQTDDAVSRTTLVSTYSYHHGFYDGVEREFRGFARVDQLDADSAPGGVRHRRVHRHPAGDRGRLHPPAGLDPHLVPHRRLLRPRRHRRAPGAASTTSSTRRPRTWAARSCRRTRAAEELREACRALRGRVLRQEVYALDGAADGRAPVRHQRAPLPGTAAAAALGKRLRRLLRLGTRVAHLPLRARSGRPADQPRLTLDVDDYGNVTRTAAVGYPRRIPASPSRRTHALSYTEADVINVADQPGWYRIGLPAETRSYELTGIAPSTGAVLYDPGALLTAAAAAAEIPYEATPDETSPQRRLIARARTIYRKDDLSGVLPAGQADPLALVDATYRLDYTPGLLSGIYGTKISPADLASSGRVRRPRRRRLPLVCVHARPSTPPTRPPPTRPTRGSTSTCLRGNRSVGKRGPGRLRRPQPAGHPDHRRGGQHRPRLGQLPGAAAVADHRPQRQPQRRPLRRAGHGGGHRQHGQAAARRHRRRRPPRHQHRRTGRRRRPDRRPRLRPVGVPDVGGRPQPRPRPPAASLGAHSVPGTAQRPGNALAGDLRLQRRLRAGRPFQGPGRSGPGSRSGTPTAAW